MEAHKGCTASERICSANKYLEGFAVRHKVEAVSAVAYVSISVFAEIRKTLLEGTAAALPSFPLDRNVASLVKKSSK